MSNFESLAKTFRLRSTALAAGLLVLAAPSRAASVPVDAVWMLAATTSATTTSGVTFLGNGLTSDRFSGLPAGTLQLTLAYDGDETAAPSLNIQFRDAQNGQICWHLVDTGVGGGDITNSGTRIHTYEFDITSFEPTGLVVVSGVIPNGVVDGLAFGLFWKNASGGYRMMKSNTRVGATTANYWGAWPIAMDYASFQALTDQLNACPDSELCRRGAQTALWGAQLLTDGIYFLGGVLHRIRQQ